jgi:hypothetical protein
MKKALVISAVLLMALAAAVVLSRGQTRTAAPLQTGLTPEARQAVQTVSDDMTKLVDAHGRYVRASLDAEALTAKLLASVREVAKLAADAGKAGPAGEKKLFDAIQKMDEMSQSFNLQYLQLQQQMQNENRQFTMVSNIMKTKHDTAKNAIANIR